jgi:hypothetical protein
MVGIVAIAISLVGILRGAIWGGLLLAFGDDTVLPGPTPMQAVRFWVFVGWWLVLITIVVGLLAGDRLKASSDQGGRWTRLIVQGMIALVLLVSTIGTIIYTGLEFKSYIYYHLSNKYGEMSVKESPKVAPAGDPAKYKFYSELSDKYSAAGGSPWRAVAPDPPEPH